MALLLEDLAGLICIVVAGESLQKMAAQIQKIWGALNKD